MFIKLLKNYPNNVFQLEFLKEEIHTKKLNKENYELLEALYNKLQSEVIRVDLAFERLNDEDKFIFELKYKKSKTWAAIDIAFQETFTSYNPPLEIVTLRKRHEKQLRVLNLILGPIQQLIQRQELMAAQ